MQKCIQYYGFREKVALKRRKFTIERRNSQGGEMSIENDVQIRKSNPLIRALGNPTSLANKIMWAAFAHAEMADPKNPSPLLNKKEWARISELAQADYTKGLVAIFPQSEVRLTAKKGHSGSYYKALNELLNSNPQSKTDGLKSLQNQWTVIFEGKGFHESVSLISACAYDEKTKMIFIKFSDEEKVQKHLYNLKGDFTIFSYKKMMQFKSNYSAKLYEIIKSRIDFEEAKTKVILNRYEFEYNIAHLKYMLGVIDPFYSNETIKMLAVTNPDYDAAAEKIKGEGMPKWYDFKRNCLDKCQVEFNKLTEFNLDYVPGERKGKGGKITEVKLIVERKVDIIQDSNVPEISEEKLFELIDQARDIIKENISTTDIKMLIEKADYDINRISTAYEVYKEYNTKEPVESIAGFMRRAIEENWKPKKKNTFNRFEQNKNDFEELEALLLDN